MSSNDNIVSLDTCSGDANRHNSIENQVRARKLLDTCRSRSVHHLQNLLQRMMDNADDALFAMADKAGSNTEQTIYFDSMRVVRLHRQIIEQRFIEQIKTGFENYTQAKPAEPDDPLSVELSMDEISLVEDTDLEESLAVTNLVSKVRDSFGPALNALDQRLASLFPQHAGDAEHNPLGPACICNAFRDAMQELDAEIKIKLIIHKLFDRQMICDIGSLYEEINQFLVDNDVLPEIRIRIQRNPETVRSDHSSAALAAAEPAGTESGSAEGDFLGALQQLLANSRGPGVAAGTPGAGTGIDAGIGIGSGATNENPPGASAPISPAMIMNALTDLQHAAAPESGSVVASGETIRLALSRQAGLAEHTGPILQGVDNDLIDVIAMMFEYILEDPELPATARALLGRLQIPMLKVAILDKQFFASKTHPARQLLNSLAAAGLGLDDEAEATRELLELFESIVNRILEDFADDVGLFAELQAELDHFLEQRAALEVEQQTDSRHDIQLREQLELARSWVRETLKESLADTSMPRDLLGIIMGPWHEVMTRTWLDQGDQSPLWKNQLRFIDVLAWSVQPKQIKVDRRKLGGIIRHLTTTLRNGLESIDYPAHKIDRIFDAIEPYHHASLHGLGVAGESQTGPSEPVATDSGAENPSGSFYLFESEQLQDPVPTSTTNAATDQENPANDRDTAEENTHATDPASIDSAIDDLEAQMATLDELEAILESQPGDGAGTADDNDAAGTPAGLFDKEIMEDIVLAGWECTRPDEDPADYPDDEYLELARHLEAGKWVEFTDENTRKVRAKLSWKSDLLGEYTFTNWKFDVVADKTLQGFAADLRRGTARIIDDIPVLDRALSAVMNSLARQAG